MKKFLSILAVSCLMAACGSNSSDSATTTDTATVMNSDTASVPATTDTTTTPNATMKDGVMALKAGKMMVTKNGTWEAMTEDVTCTNGVKVKTTGEISKGTRKKTLTEGMMIDQDGQLTDADGKSIDNAGW